MGFFDTFTGGHGILGRKGLKHERELTDVMLDQVRNDQELGTELAPLLENGKAPMTVEQHRAYRAMIAGRAQDLGTVSSGMLGFRAAQSHLRKQTDSPDNIAQLDVMDTQADYAHKLMVSNNPKLQEAGTALMSKVLGAQQDYATTNEAQRLAKEAQDATMENTLGQRRWSTYQGLQDNYRNESAPFLAQRQAFGTLQAALKDPSAAGDVSLLFAYMKLLDPGSVVREGEFATAQNTSGVPDLVMTAYNRVLRDGQRLTPDQRKDFYGQAVTSFGVARESQLERNTRYLGQARDNGLPESMLGNFTLPLDALGVAPTGFGTDPMNAPAPASDDTADSKARMVGESIQSGIATAAGQGLDFLKGVVPWGHVFRPAGGPRREPAPPDYPKRGTINRPVNE